MQRPRVSVVLPVWNGEKYFAEAIRSILDQTFESFELLIVDDGSTDRTPHIAEQYGAMDSRVRLVRTKHGGIANALNTGFRQARASYVARMDADDIALPSRLQKQVDYLDEHQQCVVVGSDAGAIDENENDLGVIDFPSTHAELVELLLNGRSPFLHPAVVMRRDAVHAVGGYRPDLCPSEDYELWLRLIHSGEFASIPERLLCYRLHRNSVCMQNLHLQLTTTRTQLNAARAKIGWQALRRQVRIKKQSALAVYHNRCSRTALKSGRRALAISHAFSGITSAPFWVQPYTALAACALPVRVLPRLIKCAAWLRTI